MTIGELSGEVMDDDQIVMATKIIMADGRGIVSVETGWDDYTDEPILWLFPERKQETKP